MSDAATTTAIGTIPMVVSKTEIHEFPFHHCNTAKATTTRKINHKQFHRQQQNAEGCGIDAVTTKTSTTFVSRANKNYLNKKT